MISTCLIFAILISTNDIDFSKIKLLFCRFDEKIILHPCDDCLANAVNPTKKS